MGKQDYFPVWKPRPRMFDLFKRYKEAWDWAYKKDLYAELYRLLRNSCSAFTKKPTVREYLIFKYMAKCNNCGSNENLTIDHVISIVDAIDSRIDLKKLNSESNLQVLCRNCNCSKTHLNGKN
jgi:5-methylcytosine-specific restriction endonuclease McrA